MVLCHSNLYCKIGPTKTHREFNFFFNACRNMRISFDSVKRFSFCLSACTPFSPYPPDFRKLLFIPQHFPSLSWGGEFFPPRAGEGAKYKEA